LTIKDVVANDAFDITGIIAAPITLVVKRADAVVTWKATGDVDAEGDLIAIGDESVPFTGFVVEVGDGNELKNTGNVFRNLSDTPITITSGTLESSGGIVIISEGEEAVTINGGDILATGVNGPGVMSGVNGADRTAVYAVGDVTVDSAAADVTIKSAEGFGLWVAGGTITINGDAGNNLTIETAAGDKSAIHRDPGAAGAKAIDINGAARAKTSIIGLINAIVNYEGDIDIEEATITNDSTAINDSQYPSCAVRALNGIVTISDSIVQTAGEKSAGVYSEGGNVIVKGDSQITANDAGGIAVLAEEGDVSLEDTAVLSATDGGPVVDARDGDVAAAAGVKVDSGSATGLAIRASGTITAAGADIKGETKENHDYSASTSPSGGSGGCDAGFGGLFGILALAGTALIRGKR
jgi:autotransporter family porin